MTKLRIPLEDFIRADGLAWRSSHRRAMVLAMSELSKKGGNCFHSVAVAEHAKESGDEHCSNLSGGGVAQNLRKLAVRSGLFQNPESRRIFYSSCV